LILNEFKYFYPERAALIHKDQPLFETLSKDPKWIAEPKFNGCRLQLHHLADNTWEFWNRHGQKMSYNPSSELLKDLNELGLKGYWLLDGELRNNKVAGIKDRVVLYDVFVVDGHILNTQTFQERREILETLFHYCGPYDEILDLTVQFNTDFTKEFERYGDDKEIEGLVLKNLNGKLNLGRTSSPKSIWQFKVRKATNSVRF
jgi:ATP-dependent DNA ligase